MKYPYVYSAALLLFLPIYSWAQQIAYEANRLDLNEFETTITQNTLRSQKEPSETYINILPVEPHTTVGTTLKVMASSFNPGIIKKQEWKDLKTGMSANYKLKGTDQSVLTIDASIATVGDIHLEYHYTDLYGRTYVRETKIHIYGEDHGDLPGAEDATHIVPIEPLVLLGNIIDTELNDQPSLSAGGGRIHKDGDDFDLSDDEDGIFQPVSIRRNQESVFYAEVINNTNSSAHLTAFIDWDKNGKYDDLNEVVTISIDSTPKKIVPIRIKVPAIAKINTDIYARFRLSTDLNAVMQFSGPAKDGEVEDYVLRVEK